MMLKFFKGQPNTHVVLFRNGEVVREGRGLNFWYLPLNSTIGSVPVGSQEAPFIFTLPTSDFQQVSVQGSFVYRITDPSRLVQLLDYTIEPQTGYYLSEDPDKLVARIVNAIHAETRASMGTMALRSALTEVRSLSDRVLETLQTLPDLLRLGIEVAEIYFTVIKATPEMQKALEAEYRETLQREADQAIYARRAAAVEEERHIKESELNTDVELERRKEELVDTQARNTVALAQAEAKAEELKLAPYNEMEPQVLVGLALRDWAACGGTVGNLSITPDMLGDVLSWMQGGRSAQG